MGQWDSSRAFQRNRGTATGYGDSYKALGQLRGTGTATGHWDSSRAFRRAVHMEGKAVREQPCVGSGDLLRGWCVLAGAGEEHSTQTG